MKFFHRKPSNGPSLAGKQDMGDVPLYSSLEKNIEMLQPYLQKNADVISRSFFLGGTDRPGQIIYINLLVDNEILNQHIIAPLMLNEALKHTKGVGPNLVDIVQNTSLTVGQVRTIEGFDTLVHAIFDGLVVILLDGSQKALAIDIHGGETRQVEEPPSERVTRGPREGFVESLDVNIALVRRHMRDPHLVVEKTMVGKRSRTPVALLYVDDIVAPEILSEIKKRINRIETDIIPGSGHIEQYIEDNPFSLFPQMWTSERPDRVLPQLAEGRVAIMVDGSPTILFGPSLLVMFLQASEDYMQRTFFGSYVRFLRYIAFVLAISLPALYVALVSFQPELIPINLLVSLAQARKEVPFPAVVEVLIQELIIQLIIETGMRMPQPIGQTTGVVAGIILGQAAISAKLASPGVIVVIVVTTICTFALPTEPLVQATRIIRLPILVLSSLFGLFGFSMAWLFLLGHLISLESFGVAFMSPISPIRNADMKDVFFRTFLWKMDERPVSMPTQDKKRQGRTRGKDLQSDEA